MNVALYLPGQARGFKSMYNNFKEKIILKFNPDIFISTWLYDFKNGQPADDEQNNWRLKDEGSYEEYIKLYKPKASILYKYNNETIKFFNRLPIGRVGPRASVSRTRMHYFHLLSCDMLCNNFELMTNKKYDVVIKYRPDIVLNEEIVESILLSASSNDIFYSTSFVNGTGMQVVIDVLCISNRKLMSVFCNIYNDMEIYNSQGVLFDPEFLHIHHMLMNNVNLFDVIFSGKTANLPATYDFIR
mgnify:CR=1 FL=1